MFLTIFLNIIFCQFIYLPIFAVPAFNEITWKIGLNASTNVTTPSFAIIQNTQLARRATLEEDTTSLQQLCDQKMNNPVFDNQWCFQEPKNFTYVDEQQHEHQVRYVTFDGNLYPTIDMDEHLSLWYQYKCRYSVVSFSIFDIVLTLDRQIMDQPRKTQY